MLRILNGAVILSALLFVGAFSITHAQPADNLLQSDTIFDTLSVDLKVNGSDGPVNVAAGERITISWESDGAKRCKGNWSKKDLRLNGKITGKLNRSLTGSVTVRIACIDADGNREDDSVVLKITGSSTAISSALKLLDIVLLPAIYRGENITEFPLGQVFDMSVFLDRSYGPPEVDLKNIKVEVSESDGYVYASFELECEKSGNIFNCANNVWNTSNLSNGQRKYKFNISGTDSLGKNVHGFVVRDFSFKEVSHNLCKAVYPQHNTVAENRINLIFVGSGYSNVSGESFSEVFKKIAAKLIDLNAIEHGLFSVDPFKSNKNSFNFWYIDKAYPLERCTLINNNCPREDIFQLAENCPYPNQYVLEVHDRIAISQEVGSFGRHLAIGFPYRSLALKYSPESDSYQRTFVHEFAHAFANLGDEYVIFPNQKADLSLINIQKLKSIFQVHKNVFYGTLEECQQNAPWRDVPGTGCFEGAGKIGLNAFRPTENSLMRDQFSDPFTFGPYNSLLIHNIIVNIQHQKLYDRKR